MFSRRCGVGSIIVLAILAFLVGAPIALPQAITLVRSSTRSAGSSASGYNSDFGSATTINLSNPSYIAFDSNGNQFISDTLNNCVRKIDTAGNVSTIAGLAVSGQSDTCNSAINATPTAAQGLYRPTGLAIDSTNRLYIADSMHHCIRALVNGDSGVASLTTVAGTCGSVSSDSATPAPNGLAIDASNNLYIALQDSASATPIYQVVAHTFGASASNVCLIAGAASANVAVNCPGVTNGVALVKPSGLAVDISGDLYIADTGNNCIREVTGVASGAATETTAVGQCLNDASGTSATTIHNPYGLAISPTQSLFISQSNPDSIVSYTPGSNGTTTIGGLPSGVAGPYDSTQDGQSALSSPLNGPRGITFDSNADLFVADSLNNVTRQLSNNLHFPTTPVGSPSSVQPITFVVNQPVNLTTVAGTDYSITSTTCSGSLLPAPTGTTPNTCQVFVRFTPTRPGLRRSPLQLTDTISNTSVFQGLQAVGTGALSIFAPGTPSTILTNLASPASIVTDAAGNAYVLETATTGTPDIRIIPTTGGASNAVLSLPAGLTSPSAIAADAAGNWYVADAAHGTVSRFGADGSSNAAYITGLDIPTALCFDLFNNLYIAQAGGAHNVLVAYSSGARRIVAGSGSNTSADGVTAVSASFVSPSSIVMDLNGSLYVADQGGHRVYAVDKSGIIHVVAGNGTTSSTLTGHALGTALTAPTSLAIDAAGDLYVADQFTGDIYAVYSSTSTGSNIAVVLNASAPQLPNGPIYLALDGDSNLFVSQTAPNSVIKLSYPNPTLDFGSIPAGETSSIKLQSIINVGTDNLNITSPFSTTDSHFAFASGSATCGTTILTGSLCTIGFTFTPTEDVPYTASSVVNSNSHNTPQPITLVGGGKHTTTITVVVPAQSKVYGQPFPATFSFGNIASAPTGTVTFTTAGQVLCTFTGTFSAANTCDAAASGLAVGSYNITFNYSGDTNYAATTINSTLTVLPAALTITANNTSRSYGTANPALSGAAEGLLDGDIININYLSTATVKSPVGSYPIIPVVSGAALSNYNLSIVNGTLTVTGSSNPLTINIRNATHVYGQANPAFSGVVAGILPGDNVVVTYSTTATATSSAGSYPVIASLSGISAGSYIATVNPGTLTITQASTVTSVVTSTPSTIPGTSITFTAHVKASSGSVAGIVSFFDGTVLLGNVNLNSNGVATYSTTDLSLGSHAISAAFQANTNFTTSAASAFQTITPPPGSFTLTSNAPAPFIHNAGTTTYQVTVNAIGAFIGPVSLACSGLPADASCSFTKPIVNLTAGGTATTTMTITTKAADAKLQAAGRPSNPGGLAPFTLAAIFPAEFSGLGFLFAGLRRRKEQGSRKARPLLLLAFTLSILSLMGCGYTLAPIKTYTINITATSLVFVTPNQTTSVVLSVIQE